MMEKSRYKPARRVLLFWCLFIGVGAVAGAVGMLSAPDGSAMGMQALLPFFQVLPFADALFQNFIFPGIALLCVNGIPNLIAAALLLGKKRSGTVLGGILGVTLMLWICIQFVIFPANVMSISYFIFGICQAIAGASAYVFCRQEAFCFRAEDYPHVGSNPRELVVYFSRMGYTRKIAYAEAERTGAAICEIRAAEPTAGTKGFWWCGRYGMHRWVMPIQDVEADPGAYEKVTICSPIWVFELAGPMRSFCRAAAGKIRRADYILVHHTGRCYQNAAAEMDALLGIRHETLRSIRCRMGRCTALSVPGEKPPAASSAAR